MSSVVLVVWAVTVAVVVEVGLERFFGSSLGIYSRSPPPHYRMAIMKKGGME